jgi:hypothetical protein
MDQIVGDDEFDDPKTENSHLSLFSAESSRIQQSKANGLVVVDFLHSYLGTKDLLRETQRSLRSGVGQARRALYTLGLETLETMVTG